MAEDYSIIEDELTHQLSNLKKDLHMRKIKTFGKKHHIIRKIALQRKQIRILSRQVEELEPTVSKIYSPQNALKDYEIKGYLIYLLKLKDCFSREVETKREIIQQRDDQIRQLVVKLCAMRNEYAKKKRSIKSKSSEFTQLENLSNKINQLEQRISLLKHEIRGQRESIMDMHVFQKQYKKFENKFRSRIMRMTADVQLHLDRAVATYEEREDFVRRARIYKDRWTQDLRKAKLNENALQLVLDKTEKYEDFENLQNEVKYDTRIAATCDLIDQGLTGLEPDLEEARDLYSALLVHSSMEEEKEDWMEKHFKLTDDKTESMLSYLEQLKKEMHHTQIEIDGLKKENRRLLKSMNSGERKMRWKIKETQKKSENCFHEASASEQNLKDAREQLDSLLEKVQSLHNKCWTRETKAKADEEEEDPETGLEEDAEEDTASEATEETEKEAQDELRTEICDSNAIDFEESIEKKILELLMGIEYLRMEELSEEDLPISTIGDDAENDNLDEIDEPPEIAYLDTIQPRVLKSATYLETTSDVDQVNELEELKEKAISTVTEIESERNSESED